MAAGWWTGNEINGLVLRKRAPTTACELWKDEKAEVKEQHFKREISSSDVVHGVAVEWVALREWRIRLLGWRTSRNGEAKLLGGLPR